MTCAVRNRIGLKAVFVSPGAFSRMSVFRPSARDLFDRLPHTRRALPPGSLALTRPSCLQWLLNPHSTCHRLGARPETSSLVGSCLAHRTATAGLKCLSLFRDPCFQRENPRRNGGGDPRALCEGRFRNGPMFRRDKSAQLASCGEHGVLAELWGLVEPEGPSWSLPCIGVYEVTSLRQDPCFHYRAHLRASSGDPCGRRY